MHEVDKQILNYASMKFEEKRGKKKNCEISHINRTTATPEVYKQTQNTLFIIECVEHRVIKVIYVKQSIWTCIVGLTNVG